MLREVFEYIFTPCDPAFRKLGYLRELIATEARYRRCNRHWAGHLDRSRAAIARAVEQTTGRNSVVVLGGGMLHDVPIKYLTDRFGDVVLIDVCFARSTVWPLLPVQNVRTGIVDLTGYAKAIAGNRTSAFGGLRDLTRDALPEIIRQADLVISANVLSQLPLLPMDYLRQSGHLEDVEAEAAFGRMIVEDHVRLLEACHGTVCLISEFERLIHDDGQVMQTDDALFGADLPTHEESWVWDIAPRPEVFPDRDIQVRVAAMTIGPGKD